MTTLPSVGDTSNSWIALFKKIHDQYDAKAPFDGNVLYGMGAAYTFVQAMLKAGRNPTRADLVSAINSGLPQGDFVAPLAYSATDHDGATGAYIGIINNGVLTQEGPVLRHGHIRDRRDYHLYRNRGSGTGQRCPRPLTLDSERSMTTDERPPAERLLAAAEELFGQRSYSRTTVADICARAGMATGSFYAYFGSKEEIFAAVVRAINADLRMAMKTALAKADGGQRTRERECFRVYFEMMSKRPWMDRIVRESEFVAPALFREYYEHLARGYARGVRVAQLAGEVDARYDPEVIAYAYTGIGNFVGMRWADWTAGGQVPEDVLDDVLELLARGLAPPAGAQLQPRLGPRRGGAPAPASRNDRVQCLSAAPAASSHLRNAALRKLTGHGAR